MSSDWTRYSCQMNLPGFSSEKQEKLAGARVLVAGAGGLGCPAAQYLVSSGIGTIAIADDDIVTIKNLHRQILYTAADVGKKKVEVAAQKLLAQNPAAGLLPLDMRIDSSNVMELVSAYDIVVDCTDNFETRYLLNDACVLAGKPLVYGAIYQYEGQVAVWNVAHANGTRSPNYRDLYPDVSATAVPDCTDGGVLPTVAGMIGMMQANEVLKYITGIGQLLAGKVLLLDVRDMQTRIIQLGTVTRTAIHDLGIVTSVLPISHAALLEGDYLLIDVRTEAERNAFHIGGIHIPLQDIAEASVDISKPVVCYCATGMRSIKAARYLAELNPGLKVYSLQGGVNTSMQPYQG